MTIELRPLGVTCNLQCAYCYQYPQRTNRRGRSRFDLDRMKEALRTEGREFTLFGGEPLLLPLDVLKDLFAWGQAQYGRTGVQTNGTLITDAHIALFKTYAGLRRRFPRRAGRIERLGDPPARCVRPGAKPSEPRPRSPRFSKPASSPASLSHCIAATPQGRFSRE